MAIMGYLQVWFFKMLLLSFCNELEILFQAEEDKRLQATINEELNREMHIMKDVDGWKMGESVYSKRWMPPTPGLGK